MNDRRVALVTGGAVRVGAVIVRALAAAGYSVGVHANRSLDRATELVAELAEAGHEAAAFGADLRDEEATRAMIDRVRRHFGRLDQHLDAATTSGHAIQSRPWCAMPSSSRFAPTSDGMRSTRNVRTRSGRSPGR